jgi:hypothetical protein
MIQNESLHSMVRVSRELAIAHVSLSPAAGMNDFSTGVAGDDEAPTTGLRIIEGKAVAANRC